MIIIIIIIIIITKIKIDKLLIIRMMITKVFIGRIKGNHKHRSEQIIVSIILKYYQKMIFLHTPS